MASFSARSAVRIARIGPSGGCSSPYRLMSALLNGRSQANVLPSTSQVLLVFLNLSTPSVTWGSPVARCATSSKVCTPKTVRPRRPADQNGGVIEELIDRMAALLEPLRAAGDQRQYFHATYQRTTIAVAGELRRGGFIDAEWVERWDVAFADLYLDALQAALAGRRPTRPWDI